MLKRLVVFAVLTTLLAVGAGLYTRQAVTQAIDGATLSGKAALAVGRGESEVSLVSHDSFEGVDSLTAAVGRYTIVEATPISKNSYILDQYSIGTWYKFRVHRFTKQNPLPPCTDCSAMPDPPADQLPLNSDEMMVLHAGGTQVVDGIIFHVTVPDFPDFTLNQRYLLFIDYDATKKVGLVSPGPPGVYMVNGTGGLVHVYSAEPDDTIGSGLTASYANNANTLYTALNPPSQPPSGCDPAAQQACNARGGGYYWEPFSCTCEFDPCLAKPWLCP